MLAGKRKLRSQRSDDDSDMEWLPSKPTRPPTNPMMESQSPRVEEIKDSLDKFPAAPAIYHQPRKDYRPRMYIKKEKDKDDLLFCDECQKNYKGECLVHGFIPIWDSEAPREAPDRALLTLPLQLGVLAKVTADEDIEYLGVWTKIALPRRARFGPYEGVIKPVSEGKAILQGWEIMREGKPVHCVDGTDPSSSNWMRYVKDALQPSEANLYPIQYKGSMYYRTTHAIPANTELLLWCKHWSSKLRGSVNL